jgi:hypothetical protein
MARSPKKVLDDTCPRQKDQCAPGRGHGNFKGQASDSILRRLQTARTDEPYSNLTYSLVKEHLYGGQTLLPARRPARMRERMSRSPRRSFSNSSDNHPAMICSSQLTNLSGSRLSPETLLTSGETVTYNCEMRVGDLFKSFFPNCVSFLVSRSFPNRGSRIIWANFFTSRGLKPKIRFTLTRQ